VEVRARTTNQSVDFFGDFLANFDDFAGGSVGDAHGEGVIGGKVGVFELFASLEQKI